MALLDILEFPDPRLRKVAKPVEQVDERIRKQVDDMMETMYDANGIGLAATQVDFHERVIVIDVSEERDDPRVLINAEFEPLGGPIEYQEGCLSIPGFYEKITRNDHIKVTCLDRDGNPSEFEATGLFAICIQHEIDHLDGKLFVDYLSPLKRNRIKKKLEKQHKSAAV